MAGSILSISDTDMSGETWPLKSELDDGRLLVVVDDAMGRECIVVDPLEAADARFDGKPKRIAHRTDQHVVISGILIAQVDPDALAVAVFEPGAVALQVVPLDDLRVNPNNVRIAADSGDFAAVKGQ